MLACDGTRNFFIGVAARVNRLRHIVVVRVDRLRHVACAVCASGTVNTARRPRQQEFSGLEKNMAARAPVQDASCSPQALHDFCI